MNNSNLGKLISIHGLSAAILQRSMIVIILSLFFSLAMLVGWLISQKFVLLMLAVAFLAINLITLFSLIAGRKKVLSLYEQGFIYNNLGCRFDEIDKLETNVGGKINCKILTASGVEIVLNESTDGISDVVKVIKAKISGQIPAN